MRAPPAPPRRAQAFIPAACLPRRRPGRDPHPPFRLQNEAEGTSSPIPKNSLCPSRWKTRGPATRPARPRRPGKTIGQRGPGRTDWVLPGPPILAPQTDRHPHVGHYLPRIECFGRHSLVTATPCDHPEAGVPDGDRGPRAGVRALGAEPSTGHALRTRPASARRTLLERRRQSQPSVQRLDQCETRSCKKSPPLALSWPMEGRIFFGRASFFAFRSALTFACCELAGSYEGRCLGQSRGVDVMGRFFTACRPHLESCIHSFVLLWAHVCIPVAPLPGRRSPQC